MGSISNYTHNMETFVRNRSKNCMGELFSDSCIVAIYQVLVGAELSHLA